MPEHWHGNTEAVGLLFRDLQLSPGCGPAHPAPGVPAGELCGFLRAGDKGARLTGNGRSCCWFSSQGHCPGDSLLPPSLSATPKQPWPVHPTHSVCFQMLKPKPVAQKNTQDPGGLEREKCVCGLLHTTSTHDDILRSLFLPFYLAAMSHGSLPLKGPFLILGFYKTKGSDAGKAVTRQI